MSRARVAAAWRAAWTVLLLGALAPAAADPQRGARPPFPHIEHERLFPTCEGCHAGVQRGDAATTYPAEASCGECHNGTDERAVTWRRPLREAGLLRFSHPEHAAEVDSAGRACATCHSAPNARFMDVHPARPESCLGCHTHRASAHLAEDNRCATCHVALTAAPGLSRERVAALPKPPSHEREDFETAHEPTTELAAASCAVCHARESCARCHVNASTQPVIAALGRDERVAALTAGRAPVYPVPADHHDGSFLRAHGDAARRDVDRCGTCHARPSCTTCHLGSGGADVIRRIPEPEEGGATGVRLMLDRVRVRPPGTPLMYETFTIGQGGAMVSRVDSSRRRDTPRPVRVHEADFRRAHRSQAATGALNCSGCHAQSFCADCHAGEGQRRYHPANFTVRHAASGYARETDCATCHSTEAFCRSCHQQAGLSSRGRLDVAFHTAQPQWLLQHGRAARQGLQNCASCHVQRDCMTCHATTGWGVNPHGPGFNASRAAARAPASCLACHLGVPGRSGTP